MRTSLIGEPTELYDPLWQEIAHGDVAEPSIATVRATLTPMAWPSGANPSGDMDAGRPARRLRYLKSRERVLDQQRDCYAAHREEICAAKRTRYETNSEYFRAYYWRNRKKMLEYGRKYREARKAQSATGY